MSFLKNYSMTLLRSTVVLLLIGFTFCSCKKDKDEPVAPVSPVVGKWTGTLKTEGAPVGTLYLMIRQGGTLEAQNNSAQKIGEGTWQLGGAGGVTFSCSFTTNVAGSKKTNLLGTLVDPVTLNGTWGTGSSTINGGFWNMSK